LRVTVAFAEQEDGALERAPRGTVLVRGRSFEIRAPLAGGRAMLEAIPPGWYELEHTPPSDHRRKHPAPIARVLVGEGDTAHAAITAAYLPLRLEVANLSAGEAIPPRAAEVVPDSGDAAGQPAEPPAVAAQREPVPASAPTAAPAAPDAGVAPGIACGARTESPRAVRPGMSEAEVECILGPPRRVSRRGEWFYWSYVRSPGPAGGRYDDLVIFRNAKVVTAILREPGRRYDGPPPHQRIVEELRERNRGSRESRSWGNAAEPPHDAARRADRAPIPRPSRVALPPRTTSKRCERPMARGAIRIRAATIPLPGERR
jgi:hypothetical protein